MNKRSISPLTSVALGVVLIGWTCSWRNWYGRHCWQGRGRRRRLHRFQMIWRTCCRCYAFVLHTSVTPGENVWEREQEMDDSRPKRWLPTSRLVLRSISGLRDIEGRQECTFICSRARSSPARAGIEERTRQGEMEEEKWVVGAQRWNILA